MILIHQWVEKVYNWIFFDKWKEAYILFMLLFACFFLFLCVGFYVCREGVMFEIKPRAYLSLSYSSNCVCIHSFIYSITYLPSTLPMYLSSICWDGISLSCLALSCITVHPKVVWNQSPSASPFQIVRILGYAVSLGFHCFSFISSTNFLPICHWLIIIKLKKRCV